MFKNITDIHTHIIYDIDDGSSNCEMSLQLIDKMYDQGVRNIFCTNHSYCMEDNYEKYYENFNKLNKIIKEKYSDLKLFKGCEILCNKPHMMKIINNIKNNIFPTMNGTNYVLIEFDPQSDISIYEMIYCLRKLIQNNYVPIIAHAERYNNIYTNMVENIKYLKEIGCLIQINLYSICQDISNRKDLANLLLKNKLVDFVGSDTHNLFYKSAEIKIGVEKLLNTYEEDYCENILLNNANKKLIM